MYLVDASVGESMLKLLRWYSGTDYPFTGDIFDILETGQDIAPLDLSGARGIPIEWTVYMMAGHGAAGRELLPQQVRARRLSKIRTGLSQGPSSPDPDERYTR